MKKLFMVQRLYGHRRWRGTNQQGFVVLLSMLMLTVVGMALLSSLLLFGIMDVQSSFSLEQSGQARALANACAEEALQQINDAVSFSGSSSLSLSTGTCNYTVISLSGSQREIESVGTVGSSVRKVLVTLDQINPNIHVTSWQEVSDF
ncbi:hypothetical protein HYV70_01595 [Candidatus Uhrbacteria bacterium]|nr:hypothetical protein [Candidatus Uhrbacteria bacterium]